jgi:UDPglucose 6-dehydrogenase
MNISIIGAGHVGLVTGACFAASGHSVLCIDNDIEKVRGLQRGVIPFFEPDLDRLVSQQVESGHLSFGQSTSEAVDWSNIMFICTSTPSAVDGSADISSVEQVALEIAKEAHGYNLIVEKSTVPVETGERLQKVLDAHRHPDASFDIASVPEFLREGSAIKDTLEPQRVVIGASTDQAFALLTTLYEPTQAPLFLTNIKTAEVIKHSSNSFLALKISYINAVANICERTGADVTQVAKAMGMDPRIGSEFLNAGVGYGGSCFPKDVAAFIQVADQVGYNFELLKAVQNINTMQRYLLIEKLARTFGGILTGKRIGVLGLAFKPNTDDMREAPASTIVEELLSKGSIITAYDPRARSTAQALFGDRVIYANTPYDAASNSDALVLLTEWDEFRALDWDEIRRKMNGSTVIDGRNCVNPQDVFRSGLSYYGIGR